MYSLDTLRPSRASLEHGKFKDPKRKCKQSLFKTKFTNSTTYVPISDTFKPRSPQIPPSSILLFSIFLVWIFLSPYSDIILIKIYQIKLFLTSRIWILNRRCSIPTDGHSSQAALQFSAEYKCVSSDFSQFNEAPAKYRYRSPTKVLLIEKQGWLFIQRASRDHKSAVLITCAGRNSLQNSRASSRIWTAFRNQIDQRSKWSDNLCCRNSASQPWFQPSSIRWFILPLIFC